jgi:hypothetical protein
MSAGLRTLPLRCYRGLKFHILFEPNAMRQKKKGGRSRPKLQAFVHHICSGSCGSSGMPISWAESFARITSVGRCFHSYVGKLRWLVGENDQRQKQKDSRSGRLVHFVMTEGRWSGASCPET